MTVVNLRSLRNEADFLPASIDDAAAVRAAVLEAGHTPALADGLVGWLIAKAAGHADNSSPTTRSRYRRILATLPPTVSGNATGRYRTLAA
jgi:hypothetical protein